MNQLENVVLQLADAVKALTPLSSAHEARTVDSSVLIPRDALTAAPTIAAALAAAAESQIDTCLLAQPCAEEGGTLSGDWILTTHVGSLPRATGTELSSAAIIAMQQAAGLHVINDGEWSRENYIGDMLSRIHGVGSNASDFASAMPDCLCEMPCAADMKAVPTYAQRFTGGNGLITLNPKRIARADVACTRMPRYLGTTGLKATLKPFLDALTKASIDPAKAFWTVPSPGTLALFCEDRFFAGDHNRYVNSLAEAVRLEYEAIASTGLQLQVDCPDLAMGRHTRYMHLSDEEFSVVAAANVEALNHALTGIPQSQVRIHVCWGNYAGPHHLDLAAYSIWPHVANVHAKYVLIEGANPRHGHEVAAYEQAVSSGLIDPAQMIICPGVIDTTAARVEHPALVAERLLRFVKAAGHPSRVMASTDCGFASTARSVAITADLAWRKIEALIEGAALATQLYMQAQAPVPMKAPKLTPTPYRAALILGGSTDSPSACDLAIQLKRLTSTLEVLPCTIKADAAIEALRWAVDFPIALVAVGDTSAELNQAIVVAKKTAAALVAGTAASRRPCTIFVYGHAADANIARKHALVFAGSGTDAIQDSSFISSTMLDGTGFDRRLLALGVNRKPLPTEVDVVVIGGGLLGMIAAHRLIARGHSVVILEQRSLVGTMTV